MQFRAVIPDEVKPGERIRMKCPDGTVADVIVPAGLKAGETFVFELPVDQLKSPQKLLDFMQEESSIFGSMGFMSRNIYGIRDVILALIMGVIITYWTVLGFFAGVLYATREMLIATKPA